MQTLRNGMSKIFFLNIENPGEHYDKSNGPQRNSRFSQVKRKYALFQQQYSTSTAKNRFVKTRARNDYHGEKDLKSNSVQYIAY